MVLFVSERQTLRLPPLSNAILIYCSAFAFHALNETLQVRLRRLLGVRLLQVEVYRVRVTQLLPLPLRPFFEKRGHALRLLEARRVLLVRHNKCLGGKPTEDC